jgi:hypothetical protein
LNGLLASSIGGISFLTILQSTDATDGIPLWLWRAFVSICIAIIGILLKRMLDEAKDENEKRDERLDNCDKKYTDLVKITAAHEVMYEYWIDTLAGDIHPDDGRRKTDKLDRVIQSIARNRKND